MADAPAANWSFEDGQPDAASADDSSGATGNWKFEDGQPANTPPETAGRAAGLTGRALVEGTGQLEDAPMNVAKAIDGAAVWAGKKIGLIDPDYQLPDPQQATEQFRQQHPTLAAIAEHIPTPMGGNPFKPTATAGAEAIADSAGLPKAATTGERIYTSAVRAIPSAALAPEALPAILPAAAGGAASQGVEEVAPGHPVLSALAGAAAGGVTGATQGAIRGAGDTISPEAQRLMNENIRVNAAQATSSKAAQHIDRTSQMLTSGAETFATAQAGDFNSAVLKRLGVADPKIRSATPDVLSDVKDRITGVMDEAAGRGTTLDTDLNSVLGKYSNNLGASIPESAQGPLLRNIADLRAAAAENGGVIPGEVMQRVRTNLGTMSKNPAISDAAGDLRELLDDAVQRTSTPAQAAALAQARQQYRMLKQVEPAVNESGDISPQKLMSTLRQKANRNATLYGKGNQSLVQLAKDARAVIPEKLGNSGTAERFIGPLTFLEAISSDHPLSALWHNTAGVVAAATAARVLRNQSVVRRGAGTVAGGLAGAGSGAKRGTVGASIGNIPLPNQEQ